MPEQSLLQRAGSQSEKPTRYAAIYNARFFQGLFSNRNPLRSPLGIFYSSGWGLGQLDALIDGQNVELTSRLTLARRPGNTAYSTATVPDIPNSFYSFHQTNTNVLTMVEAPTGIWNFTPTSITPIFYKQNFISNPLFQFGTNNYSFYNPSALGTVTLNLISDSTVLTGLNSVLQIVGAGGSTTSGFQYSIGAGAQTSAGGQDTFTTGDTALITLLANIPTGLTLNWFGNTGTNTWLSSQAGTGGWAWYQVKVTNIAAFNGNAIAFFNTTGGTNQTWKLGAMFVTDATLSSQSFFQGVGNQLFIGHVTDPNIKWNNTVIAPPVLSTTQLSSVASGALVGATYYFKTTYVTQFGETTGSNEVSIVIAANNVPKITAPPLVSGARGWNVYISTSAGTETKQNANSGPLLFGTSFQLPNTGLVTGTGVPTSNSAQYVTNTGIQAPAAAPTLTVQAQGTSVSTSTAQFNGTTGYVSTSVAVNPRTFQIQHGFSYEILFQASVAQNGIFFGVEDGATNFNGPHFDLYFWIDSSGHVNFSCTDAPAGIVRNLVTSKSLNDGQVHHAILSMDGFRNTVIYIDGKQVAQAFPIMGAQLQNFGGFIKIGAGGSSAAKPNYPFVQAFYNGFLSRAAVYNYPLSAGQAATHYATLVNQGINNYDTIITTDLKNGPIFGSFWKLNEISGTVAADSVNTNAGTYQTGVTLNNTVTVFNGTWLASHVYSANSTVIDNNGNLELTAAGGTSGTIQPTWPTAVNGTVTDNTITWVNQGPFGISPTSAQGYVYGYSYKNSVTQHVGSMSSRSVITGPGKALFATLNFVGSQDPQVDTISIFRTTDGGGKLLELAEIPSPSAGQTVSYQDQSTDDKLNPLIPAPEAGVNNPPPTGLINLAYHMGRLWGSVKNVVYASGGPDTNPGSGNEAWPGNTWTFDSNVTKLVPLTGGMLVWTTDDLYIIAGGGSNAGSVPSFFANILVRGLGLLSYNALTVQDSLIYLFSADKQAVLLDPSAGITDLGFPIADKLFAFDPTKSYAAFLISGSRDKAFFIADGSTGWFRCNSHQVPDHALTGPVWSPKAVIVGGAGAVQAVETTPGVHQLLTGGTAPNQSILARDSSFTTFTDTGSAYSAFATIGSMVLANPGQIAELAFITCDFIKVGTSPVLSLLLDEISGTFTSISGNVVSDPPLLYGPTAQPATLFSNRYYIFSTGTSLPAWARHLQVKIDFGSDTTQNEILSFSIFGRLFHEG